MSTDTTAGANVIEGDYIGTDATGNVGLSDGTGIDIASAGNTIGGTASGAANVIAGNDGTGYSTAGTQIFLDTSASDNLVQGNYIGLGADGLALAGATGSGVYINHATGETIGGVTAAARNVISGNSGAGVEILGGSDNLIAGDYIGTDPTGTTAIGNGPLNSNNDVAIGGGATNNTVGGTTSGARNIISAGGFGVYVFGPATTENLVEGNYIGTDSTGTVALANVVGVGLSSSGGGNTIGGATSTPGTGAGNLIAGNSDQAVGLGSEPDGDVILGNVIGGVAIPGVGTSPENLIGIGVGGSTGFEIGGTSPQDENVISGNTAYGVEISGSSNSLVQGNLIGTNLPGSSAVPNQIGVLIEGGSTNITIGGTTGSPANVISGNTIYGLQITGAGTSSNVVEGDYIGTDVTGAMAIANGTGVEIEVGASDNTIGGLTTTPGAGVGNVISGNSNNGVYLSDAGTASNAIEGNLIGTDATGSAPLGNVGDGVAVEAGATGAIIGGATAGAGNVISNNSNYGVYIDASGAVVQGNLIGLDSSGVNVMGNSYGVGIGANGVTVGGTTALARNVIAASAVDGVLIGSSSVLVEGNFIGTDASGAHARGNNQGIVTNIGGSNTIGGTVTGAGNLVSGNTTDGIDLDLSNSNLVVGNLVGTDSTGNLRLGNEYGLAVFGSSNTIGGLTGASAGNVVSANLFDGIIIASGTGNLIEGNDVGTNAAGTAALGNGALGAIDVQSGPNTVGGTTAGAGNLVSGNLSDGIILTSSASAVLVAGNIVGLSASGNAAIGNVLGIEIDGSNNTIGGTTSGAGNVISGNTGAGVELNGAGASANVVVGDDIGTNAAGTAAFGNGSDGVEITNSATGDTIGGTTAGAGNVISGNTGDGVEITGTGTTGNLVAGNLIGTDSSGTAALGNLVAGVEIDTGASANLIGGTTASARNIISANGYSGVQIYEANDNLVEGNYVGTDKTGTIALGNNVGSGAFGDGFGGVTLDGGSSGNTIGGLTATPGSGAGNVISGNIFAGVLLYFAGSDNLVAGNLIGTDSTGGVALGNLIDPLLNYGGAGVGVEYSSDTTVGELGGRNVISGNGPGTVDGTNVYLLSSTGSVVQSNFIGTDITGTVALSTNTLNGVYFQYGSYTIGGLTPTPGTGLGNVISGNSIGIYYSGDTVPDGVNIEGNIIGADATGTHELPNPNGGMIFYQVSLVTIGGTAAGAGNLISGDNRPGSEGDIYLDDSTDNAVKGNFIGTDITGKFGLQALPGDQNGIGVNIGLGSTDNTIGGITAADRNIISGVVNGPGVYIFGTGTTGNTVEGNFIGTDLTGSVAIANAVGVEIETGASGNLIGGTAAGAGNVISGNAVDGIDIGGTATSGNVVAGNDIGTDVTGTVALGNLADGVVIDTGASGNLIGGTTASARNIIAANDGSGVEIDDANDNQVEGNYVGTDKTGTVGLGNNQILKNIADGGISLENGAAGNTIGGLTATPGTGAGNLVSDNANGGVVLNYAGSNNLVAGNLIGTDSTGTVALGNLPDTPALYGGYGVDLNYSPGNTVGEPGGRNVISGNGAVGPGITNTANVIVYYSSGSAVQSNFIGTDISGTVAISSNTYNMYVGGGSSITIGGITPTPGTGLGNVISGNSGEFGLGIAGVTGPVVVEGNIIGADASGEHELPNAVSGVFLSQASGVTIGGAAAGAGNLISGDNRYGNEGNIFLDDSSDNAVEGNLIGTDITGEARLPALSGDVYGTGVIIADGSSGNTVGGTTAAARNIISGIDGPGVYIGAEFVPGSVSSGNVVLGNYIGTDAAETTALANDGDGVEIATGATGNTIGGTVAGAGNVISGNTNDGVEISGTGTSGNAVDGDFIGTDVTGTVAIANATGVELDAGASGNAIGSITAGAGNTIADNTGDGVQVVGNGTTGNPIRGNSIFGNGVLGIELGTSGVPSTNVLGGSTSGPNNDENYPVLTIVSYTPGVGTTIAGDINTAPNTTVFVDFYTDAVEGQGGYGQGQTYVGSVTVTTTNDGNASFTYLSTSLPRNAIVSATTTDPGNTSEFSLDQAEDTPPIAELVARPSPAGSPATTFNEGQTITFDGSGSFSPDGDALSYTWDFNDGTPLVTTSTPTETHAYDYDGTYVVTLTVNDGHGGIESNIDILTINKLPPTITFNPLPASLAVGTTLHLTGTIDDPTPDLETVVLNWGDGSYPTTLHLAAGSSTFSVSHDYASPLPGGATTATLGATVTDASNPAASPKPSPLGPLSPTPTFDVGGLSGSTSAMLTVFQQVPTIAGLTLSQSTVNVGGTTTLSGTIVDPNPVVSHTVTIQWGDPSPATTLDLPPGDLAFSSAHQYDSTPGDSLSGAWPIDVTVVNSNLLSGAVAPPAVTAVDVSPVVQIESLPLSTAGSLVSLLANAIEPPGTINQLTYQWTLTTGGAFYASGTGQTLSFVSISGGVFTATVVVTDQDGATGQASAQVVVGPSTPNNTVIFNPAGGGLVTITADGTTSNPFAPGNGIIYYARAQPTLSRPPRP